MGNCCVEMRICSVGTGFAWRCGLGSVAMGPAEEVVRGGGGIGTAKTPRTRRSARAEVELGQALSPRSSGVGVEGLIWCWDFPSEKSLSRLNLDRRGVVERSGDSGPRIRRGQRGQ